MGRLPEFIVCGSEAKPGQVSPHLKGLEAPKSYVANQSVAAYNKYRNVLVKFGRDTS